MFSPQLPNNLESSCSNCGAPVLFNGSFKTLCPYCNTTNTLDLQHFNEVVPHSEATPNYHCPRCAAKDWTHILIQPSQEKSTDLFRCGQCHGLFLNHKKLNEMVDNLSSAAQEEDKWTLQALAEDTPFQEQGIQYLNCPECQKLMARRNYGKSSGVIVDICPDHGTWLDGGELSKIFTWVKAGGKERQKRLAEEDKMRQLKNAQFHPKEPPPTFQKEFSSGRSTYNEPNDLINSLFKVVEWILR